MSGNTDVHSDLQAASQSWFDFDWKSKYEQYEINIQQRKEAKEQSVLARKSLGETTKRFKRSAKQSEQTVSQIVNDGSANVDSINAMVKSVETLAKESRGTIKKYQEEVDNLTRRCKSSESNYNTVCSSLFKNSHGKDNAVRMDPGVILATALEQLRVQQAQISQLVKSTQLMNNEIHTCEKENKQLKDSLAKEKAKVAELLSENQSTTGLSSSSGAGGVTSSSSTGGGLGKQAKEELVQLRQEVAEYEVEFRSLKNQDITIRKLEGKIVEMQTLGENEMKTQIEKVQQELSETEGRRAEEALEREAAAERKVQTLELQLKAERAGNEAAQSHLLEADDTAGEREAAWDAQRQILIDDTERLRLSLHQASRERDELRMHVATFEGGGISSAPSSGNGITSASFDPLNSAGARSTADRNADFTAERKAYEAEVEDLSYTAAALREDLRAKEEAIVEEREKFQTQIATLEFAESNSKLSIKSLQTQISLAPSPSLVESMKHELRILKRLEYNATEDDSDDDTDAEHSDNPEMTGGSKNLHSKNMNEDKGLEAILVAKLRRSESQLVKERSHNSEKVKECEQLRNEVQYATKAKNEAEKLVESLEKDLEIAITAHPSSPRGKKKQLQNYPNAALLSNMGENPGTLQSIMDPASTPSKESSQQGGGVSRDTDNITASQTDIEKGSATNSTTVSVMERMEDDHSVATIIMAQRDRLRIRCETLEAERDSFKHELQSQVQASESLNADNTKLYEKVRYLQNFNNKRGSGSHGGRMSSGPSSGGGGVSRSRRGTGGGGWNDRDLDLEALEERYEASVDPFKQFSRSERRRKLDEMPPMEKMVYIVAKTTLGTKGMRTALFTYVLSLHFLVFVTTYHWSTADDCSSAMMLKNEQLSHLPPIVISKENDIQEGILMKHPDGNNDVGDNFNVGGIGELNPEGNVLN